MKTDKKDSKNTSRKDSKTFKLVRSIANGNNIDAYKLLEKALKDRVSKRIDAALKDLD